MYVCIYIFATVIGKDKPELAKKTAQFLSTFKGFQFSRSVTSDSLRPHELQHIRPPCPSPTPGVHSDSLPSSQWCHPAISSSVIPFSSCPQSLPASESFPMSQLFAWCDQSIGVSALASFLPKKSQGWSRTLLFSKLSYNILKVQRRHSEVFFFNHFQTLITK